MNQLSTIRPGSSRQQGAALFMALIFLLIMTILGVFGMNLSRMENLMAGNSQFQARALSEAELTLEAAIDELEGELGPPYLDLDASGDYFYLLTADASETASPEALDWAGFNCNNAVPPGGSADSSYCYVIEYTGELEGSDDGDCSAATGTGTKPADCFRQIYRVTTQVETTRGAQRTVQAVYVSEELM
ncbi:MAG: PilX N-terminal domain-containing pilus assembly protein [Gammaproteobacteria bacterium]